MKKCVIKRINKKNRYLLLIETIMSVCMNISIILGTGMIAELIDEFIQKGQTHFRNILVPAILCMLTGTITAYYKRYFAGRYSVATAKELNDYAVEKLLRIHVSFFEREGSGKLITKLISDINELEQYYESTLPDLINNTMSIVMVLVYVGTKNIMLMLASLCLYPLVLVITYFFGKKLKVLANKRRGKIDIMVERVTDSIEGIEIIRSYHLYEKFVSHIHDAISDILENEYVRAWITHFSQTANRLLFWVPNMVCPCIAMCMVFNGKMTIGAMTAYIVLINKIMGGIKMMPFLLNEYRERQISMERIEKIFEEAEEDLSEGVIDDGNDKSVKTAVKFDKVSFGYDKDAELVLKEMSFEIPEGKVMAFVGESGQGKSTIFKLICGFYEKRSGAIYDIEAKRGNAKVQKLVIEKALRMPMNYYAEHHSGEIVSKLLNDADVASQIFTSRLRRVTTPIMSVIVYFIPMLLMNWRLALSLLCVNIISLFVNSGYINPMKEIGKDTSDKKKNMTKEITTIISGINSIKIYPGCNRLIQCFKQDVNEYSDTRNKAIKMSSMLGGINTFFDMVCALGFLMISIYFVDKNMATLGSVAAIYTLYGTFSYNFLELGKYLPELMNCIARAQILFEYLELEEEAGLLETEKVKACEGKEVVIELKDVVFSYDKENSSSGVVPLYNHVNMKIPYGGSTAVTGQSGCGKSTLFKLLLGFYPLKSGEINVLGRRLSADSLRWIRDRVAYVPQRSYLFKLSVKENIRLGREGATDEDVIMAAKAASAHEFIMALPDGYDTILSNGGGNLSGGERQRIALARAFIRKAPILLMDEATSSLDNENDKLVMEAVNKFMKKSTALIIAHRPVTIAACENRIEM